MIIEVDGAAEELRKRAETREESDRLRHEAQVLDVARHPAVVQLLGTDGDTLRLRLVEGEQLCRLTARPAPQMAAIAVAAASALADLHDLGVVHGALCGEHILIDRSGQPVLCSFGRGSTDGGIGDPNAAADVAALARALQAATASNSALHRILGSAATAAQAGRSAAKAGANGVSARRLATLLTTASSTRRRRRAPLVAVPIVVAVAAGSLALVLRHPPAHRGISPSCPAVDQGCQPLSRPGGVVESASGRYRIGQPSDLVVLGRWRCGPALPAILRPATGEVWVFDSWSRGPGRLVARLVTRVPGAVLVQVDPSPSGCDRLRVLRGGGPSVVLQPGQPA